MNLLTLQICKEEAEKMMNNPYAWAQENSNALIPGHIADKIYAQGKRTLEVIADRNDAERFRKAWRQRDL
jgi:hypothetical protein